MAELIGRKAIAEHLGVTGGEVARLKKLVRGFPARFEGRQYIAKTEDLEEWRRFFRYRAQADPRSGKVA